MKWHIGFKTVPVSETQTMRKEEDLGGGGGGGTNLPQKIHIETAQHILMNIMPLYLL